ncbi:MAG: divergent polysaccharide deacetylase family protein [Pseudomonadota bacterium]
MKLKQRMLSALFVGPLIAGLAVLGLSVTQDGAKDDAIGSAIAAPVKQQTVRLSLDLSQTQSAIDGAIQSFKEDDRAPSDIAALKTALAAVSPPGDTAAIREDALPDIRARPASTHGKVAIIIDDLGHNSRHNRGAMRLPAQVAFALLPYTRLSKTLAQKASAAGHELIVHVPMQPKNSAMNAGPHALLTSDDETQLRKTIAWNLEQFDGYYAVNNHMGSRFTEHEASMRILFEELAARGLSFYDSRTTASSSSVALAASLGVSLAERDVFLDNEQEAVAVDGQLATLEKLARRNGSAIAIGHPHQVTFEQILAWAETLPDKGLVLVKPSVIMAERRTPYWRSIVRTAQTAAPKRQTY